MSNSIQQVDEKCKYCGKKIETLERKEIIYRGYDHIRQKQVVKREYMNFCSLQCGTHYQWSCEG